MHRCKSVIALILVVFFITPKSFASAEREFVMSCTYGVLAGTLVGAATLAFVDRPSENLQKIARGASLGLYLGIGLGFYTVYVVPKQIEKEEEQRIEEETGEEEARIPKFMVFPLIAENDSGKSSVGIGAFWQITTF